MNHVHSLNLVVNHQAAAIRSALDFIVACRSTCDVIHATTIVECGCLMMTSTHIHIVFIIVRVTDSVCTLCMSVVCMTLSTSECVQLCVHICVLVRHMSHAGVTGEQILSQLGIRVSVW